MTSASTSEALLRLLAERRRGVLATLKRDGRPQLSTVSYHADGDSALVRISTRSPLAKTANLRRDPRVSLHAASDDARAYAVAEGEAQVGPVAQQPHDAVVDELVEHYRTLNGEHPDWEEFRAAMVAEERLVVRFTVLRLYGLPPA
ncbi:PPOX class F420-dependent oxidoreductase [Angustibacter peucedani]